MSNRQIRQSNAGVNKLLVTVLGCATLLIAGCNEPDNNEGVVISSTPLPVDTILNLSCEDVGIFTETCVLDDPANPFIDTAIVEFDVNNEDAFNKFELANAIPAGPEGAKARVYFWATALARRPNGENQWYTARAFHELYDAQIQVTGFGDPIIQAQALRAYRSVLDNFFGSVTFFECCGNINPSGDPVPFSVPLNELTADHLYRTESTGWARLVPGDPLLTQSLLAEWGYTYQPATGPNFDNGIVSVNEG
ncbi:MAG: hypothetical protein HKN49_09360 [Gammaproteobacteria bacterium]|nr:hypothetical protein [Gammaproteobacteria bacterium]